LAGHKWQRGRWRVLVTPSVPASGWSYGRLFYGTERDAGQGASKACLSEALPSGADPFENFAVLVIPGAKKDGFLDVAAGHLHEIAVFVLFLDQWAQSIGAID
jgi:hypothetical protein